MTAPTDPTDPSDEAFVQAAKARFDASVAQLDARTLSRLNRGRQTALAAAKAPERPVLTRWLPASGVTAAAVLAIVLLLPANGDGSLPLQQETEVELMLSDENLDMLEDLEFYAWMQGLEPGMLRDAG